MTMCSVLGAGDWRIWILSAVQKEHAPMGQADLSRAGPVSAAHQPGMGDGVVRRAEWPVTDQWRVAGQHPSG